MAMPITIAVELRGVDKATAAIRSIDPTLPQGEITERLNAAIGLLECRTRADLAEPDDWRPLGGIRVTEVGNG